MGMLLREEGCSHVDALIGKVGGGVAGVCLKHVVRGKSLRTQERPKLIK
jgi:hypothetical protein